MAATYDPSLSTAKDVVRLHIPDRDVSAARWSDEEINAQLTIQTNSGRHEDCAPFFAAAELLSSMASENLTQQGGLSKKSISADTITEEYDATGRSLEQVMQRVKYLTELGNRCESAKLSNRPARFRAIGPRSLPY